MEIKDLVYRDPAGEMLTTSVIVAEKFEKKHKHILEIIRDLVKKDMPGIRPMFRETTYQDGYGRPQGCYAITEEGFSLLAMGFTGDKALIFKLQFIEAFKRMREALLELPKNPLDLVVITAQEMKRIDGEVEEVKGRVELLGNQIRIDSGEARTLQKTISRRVYSRLKELLGEGYKCDTRSRAAGRKLYAKVHKEIREKFGVPSYRDVKRTDFNAALVVVESFVEPYEVREEIRSL